MVFIRRRSIPELLVAGAVFVLG
ncbi:MAG: hypothetical protein QOI81_758, partial [Actinomycetota bacterium]|nr:hypothetical protein [Actinomycetota bacterium]